MFCCPFFPRGCKHAECYFDKRKKNEKKKKKKDTSRLAHTSGENTFSGGVEVDKSHSEKKSCRVHNFQAVAFLSRKIIRFTRETSDRRRQWPIRVETFATFRNVYRGLSSLEIVSMFCRVEGNWCPKLADVGVLFVKVFPAEECDSFLKSIAFSPPIYNVF